MFDDTGRPSPWHDWFTAAAYEAYVQKYGVYDWLNGHLAEVAQLDDARRVLDLACGTGATARGCLPYLGRDAELVGVDHSPQMVETARTQVEDPRCEFFVGGACELSRRVDGPFDRVVCGAAFWQLPEPARVLDELAVLTERDALLALNVPASQLDRDGVEPHALQVAVERQLRAETDCHLSSAPRFGSLEALEGLLADAGFALETSWESCYEATQRELAALMLIPAMTATLAPDLSVLQSRRAIFRAVDRVDLDDVVEVPWVFLRARRCPGTNGR